MAACEEGALGNALILCVPRLLAADDQVGGFGCGKPSLNDWLAWHARQAHSSGSARTYAVVDDANGERTVAGYYSLTVGKSIRWRCPSASTKAWASTPYPWSCWAGWQLTGTIVDKAWVRACFAMPSPVL